MFNNNNNKTVNGIDGTVSKGKSFVDNFMNSNQFRRGARGTNRRSTASKNNNGLSTNDNTLYKANYCLDQYSRLINKAEKGSLEIGDVVDNAEAINYVHGLLSSSGLSQLLGKDFLAALFNPEQYNFEVMLQGLKRVDRVLANNGASSEAGNLAKLEKMQTLVETGAIFGKKDKTEDGVKKSIGSKIGTMLNKAGQAALKGLNSPVGRSLVSSLSSVAGATIPGFAPINAGIQFVLDKTGPSDPNSNKILTGADVVNPNATPLTGEDTYIVSPADLSSALQTEANTSNDLAAQKVKVTELEAKLAKYQELVSVQEAIIAKKKK